MIIQVYLVAAHALRFCVHIFFSICRWTNATLRLNSANVELKLKLKQSVARQPPSHTHETLTKIADERRCSLSMTRDMLLHHFVYTTRSGARSPIVGLAFWCVRVCAREPISTFTRSQYQPNMIHECAVPVTRTASCVPKQTARERTRENSIRACEGVCVLRIIPIAMVHCTTMNRSQCDSEHWIKSTRTVILDQSSGNMLHNIKSKSGA